MSDAQHEFSEHPANTTSAPTRLVIIGGGFSGTALAISLLRRATGPLTLTLLEAQERLGRGIAYSTREAGHLLNVPAKSMSVLADDNEHFVRWLAQHPNAAAQPYGASDYVPRRVYGTYLADTLRESVARAHPAVSFKYLPSEATDLEATARGAVVVSARGERVAAEAVILALGNLPPRTLSNISTDLQRSGRYRPDPWHPGSLDDLEPDDQLLVVGTGLTLVDLLVSLDERGHRGRVYALSRRGLLPRTHLPATYRGGQQPTLAAELEVQRPNDLATLVRCFRRAVATHSGPWQEVVDSLRALTPTLWRDLSERDQKRFLRRLRAHWDVHRSRVAPQIADVLDTWQRRGQLHVAAGQLVAAHATPTGADVMWSERGEVSKDEVSSGKVQRAHVARIINATGPETDLRYTTHPLLQRLLQSGAVEPDPSGLGIRVADGGRVLGRSPVPLYVLGALRRHESYEGIAVPELRVQAAELAETLTAVGEPERV